MPLSRVLRLGHVRVVPPCLLQFLQEFPMVGTASGMSCATRRPLSSRPAALTTAPSRTAIRKVPIKLRSPSLEWSV